MMHRERGCFIILNTSAEMWNMKQKEEKNDINVQDAEQVK